MNTSKIIKACLCGLLFLLCVLHSSAQNLVLNPSFENAPPSSPFITCPGFGDLVNWDRVETDTCSTPDLFSPACSGLFAILGSPSNNFGTQNAHSGTNYTGAYFIEGSNYREYIQGQLSSPLVAGQQYCVSFYVSFPENVPEASNRIDVYFSSTHTAMSLCNTPIIPFTPQLQACTATMITDKTNWVRLQWNYTATGGESYLIIGNFFNNAATTTSVVGVGMPGSYYYMDDVSVEPGTCCHTDIVPTSTLCSSASAITLSTTPMLNANCTTTNTPGTWSGAGITNSVSGVFNPSAAGPGNHTVSYSLTCGYTATTSITVDPCAINVCKTGSMMTASGGTAPYTWQAQTTYTDCSGCPGGNCIPFFCSGTVVTTWTTVASNTSTYASATFPVRVLDNAGNTFTITSLASLPTCSTTACPTLTLSVSSQTNVNCYGSSTGSATVAGSGGTGPYTYTWSPGGFTGASQTGLAAGTYSISMKDANACTGSGTVMITQPASALTASITAKTPAGCGSNNGHATVTAGGGTPGYTYSWSPSGGTAATTSAVGAGSYTATVTDNKGCMQSAVAGINSAGGPTLSVVSQASVSCFGSSTGSATVNAIGGTGPYTYTWSPGNLSGAAQSSLGAGTYTISSTDAGGCIGAATLTITQPASALNAVISSTTATSCGLSTGGATVTAGGGTPGYTYAWSPSGGPSANANNLAAGSYTVTVTDSKGCTKTASTLINSAGGPTVTVSSQTNVSCFGGQTGGASLSAAGGSGSYTYTWSPLGGSAASASGLGAGNYTVSVSDGNCTSFAVVTLTQSPAITATVSTGNASCAAADGSATVTAAGGTGSLSYAWTPGGAATSSISNLSAGSYTVTVTDSKGCTYSTSGIVSVNSSGFSVDAGPTAVIEPGGNTVLHATGPAGSSYSWSPPGGLSCTSCQNPTASPGETTTYTLLVTNSGGCTSADTVTVIVRLPCGELFVPTAFSPNNDGQNDVLFVNGNCVTDLEFAIFDRWGEKVFESTDVTQGWDGTHAGKKLDPAVFAYYIKATVNNEAVSRHGSITIVK